MIAAWLLAAAILLQGVTGNNLRGRAFFDANNVKVGDPLVLTIDLIGEADFRDIHPPALSKLLNRNDWKLDDFSAKTDTFQDARRLIYRVRPMREGVLWFPALEFAYQGADGRERTVRLNEIPVHAKAGQSVVVAELGEDHERFPEPDPLLTTWSGADSDDLRFAWRKACATPTAKAFAAFDTPEARLNEARCLLLAGKWAEAMKIYNRLEWRTGQTPAIEHGIRAALARKYDNPAVELPVWREVGRPLLKYGGLARAGIVGGGLLALALVFWLISRGIRALAAVAAVLLLALPASAFDVFEQMEQQMQQMRQQMQSMTSSMRFSFGDETEEPAKVQVRVETSVKSPQVGEPFDYVISLEAPKNCTIGQVSLTPTERFGLTVTGQVRNLPELVSDNPSNSVRRLAVPVRYDVPFSGRVGFSVQGMISGKRESGRRRGMFSSFTFSSSFAAQAEPIELQVRPLASAGQPSDYGGIVSEGLQLREFCDLLRVETNDVITITYRLQPHGYVPEGFLPPGAAFEWGRNQRDGTIEYRRYFVASGTNLTPRVSIPYYDPRTKKYRRAEAGGTAIKYDIMSSK